MSASFSVLYALRLNTSLTGVRRRRSSESLSLDQIAYNQTQKNLKENAKFNLILDQDIIPSTLGTITGTLFVQTGSKSIWHDGIFILLKGLTLPRKNRYGGDMLSIKQPVSSFRFTIISRDSRMTIEADDVAQYPVLLQFPRSAKRLPPPVITPKGKLVYTLQVFLSRGGKHFKVDEVQMQFEGYHNLLLENCPEVVLKPIKMNLDVQYKQGFNLLWRKRSIHVEVAVDGGSGYLPEEVIDFVVAVAPQHGQKCQEKVGFNCKVELVQKIWYQDPALERRTQRMTLKTVEGVEKEGEVLEEMIWNGVIRVPKRLTPTQTIDFMNCVSYVLKISASVSGDEDSKVVQECPVYIGTTRMEGGGGEAGGMPPPFEGIQHSQSLSSLLSALPEARPVRRRRAASVSSMQSVLSWASSTPSIFKLPPAYSELSSRRSSLETLPPAYSEVEHNVRLPPISASQSTK